MAQTKRKHEGSKDDGPSKARSSSPAADGGADADDDSNDDAMVTISGGDNDPQMPMIRVRENALSRRSFAGRGQKDRVALAGAPLTRDKHLLAATIDTLLFPTQSQPEIIHLIYGYCVQDAIVGQLHMPSRSVYSWPVASNLHIVVDAELQAAAIASGPRWDLEVRTRLEFGSIWERRAVDVKHGPFSVDTARGPRGLFDASLARADPFGLALEMPDRSVVVWEYKPPRENRVQPESGWLSHYRVLLEEGDRVIGFYSGNVKDYYGETRFTWIQGQTHMYANGKTLKMGPRQFSWSWDGYLAPENWVQKSEAVDALAFDPTRSRR